LMSGGGAGILTANNEGRLPIYQAVSGRKLEVAKFLLQHIEDLTWIGNLNSSDAPALRLALHLNVLVTDNVVEILECLVGQNPELVSSRDQDGTLPLHIACRRGFFLDCSISSGYLQRSIRRECDFSRRLAALSGMRDA
jgi:ankyrin repeat protein